MIRHGRLTRTVAAAVWITWALGLCPAVASAQVFIASKPHPEFWIAPVLITANVARKHVDDRPGPLTIVVSFSVAPPPARDPSEFAQDIFLLWPGELVGTDGVDGADPCWWVLGEETAGFKCSGTAASSILGTGPSPDGHRPGAGRPA